LVAVVADIIVEVLAPTGLPAVQVVVVVVHLVALLEQVELEQLAKDLLVVPE
jgi:hypothetical protein